MLVLKPGKNANDASCVVDEANVDGLFDFSTFHIIKQTEARFIYKGPKIPKDQWYQMLAFFKWTYDTHHSESQARLYVNRAANTWKIWVYPQESKTGMSARELDNEEMHRQQALLGPEWMAFGTVHHHCNGSAFQSGTDERNEENQDGLHITIGDMGKQHYDIHSRFYRKGKKFVEFPLSWFWDVTEVIDEVPEWMWAQLQGDAKRGIGDKLAKFEMTTPAGADVTFPEQWRDNVIDITPPGPISILGFGDYPEIGKAHPKRNSVGITHSYSNLNDALIKRVAAAWEEIMGEAFYRKIGSDEMKICVDILNEDEAIESIMAFACYRHKVDPGDLNKYPPYEHEFAEHDEDLVKSGVVLSKKDTGTIKLPDIKTTTTTKNGGGVKGTVDTKTALGMSDAEWADYHMEQLQRGGID